MSFLFSSENSSISLDILQQCSDIASRAEYEKNQKGGICIKVNGFKIVQTNKGDVIVTGGQITCVPPAVYCYD
jgi:TATA-box binding protein (TBP) (component of TFIID and TFIIIB)